METKNFILKEIEPSDIQNIFKGLSDPEITRFYDVHFESIEATQEQMEWYRDLKEQGTGIWWGIFSKEGNEFYGAGGFNNLDKTHRKAEIGLWLLKEFWGKGILKEVMPRLFDFGFSELNLNRIEGFVVSDNIKCKQALEKINFRLEGTMRECEIKNGQPIDIDIYAILKKEWNSSKP